MAKDNEITYSDEQRVEHQRRERIAAKANKQVPDPREESAEPEPAVDTAPPTPEPTAKEKRGKRKQ